MVWFKSFFLSAHAAPGEWWHNEQATLWGAEPVKFSPLQTSVLLSPSTGTSASPPQVLHSLSLFCSQAFRYLSPRVWPSKRSVCLGYFQAPKWWLARTRCWLHSWAPRGPSPSIPPRLAADFHQNWGKLTLLRFLPLCQVWSIITWRLRGTDRQADNML